MNNFKGATLKDFNKDKLENGIFCNRTLNLNSIKAIGYDLDYTLVHYNVEAWESCAYEFIKSGLVKNGWPIEDLKFDIDRVARGLIIDKKLGNIVKANRFGYIKTAYHGTKKLDFSEMRKVYSGILVEPSSKNYAFLDTLFSLSEGCIYAQLVDLFDEGKLPEVKTYYEIADEVRFVLDRAHMEGALKAEIMSNPKKFVELDPLVTKTLLDQKESGKKLMLITNSEWEYTNAMLTYAIDPFLPDGMRWRDLFNLIILSARKPGFFTTSTSIYEMVSDDGLLKQNIGELKEGGIYVGGNVRTVEEFLGISGDSILYVGDHIFSDVIISKTSKQWRTAMIVRELDRELRVYSEAFAFQDDLQEKMQQKEELEDKLSVLKLMKQRVVRSYGDRTNESAEELEKKRSEIKDQIKALDDEIAPLAMKQGDGVNKNWGFLMRTGNDKSFWISQIEKYADIYLSKVSNFYHYTPFKLFRSHRSSLAHDPVKKS